MNTHSLFRRLMFACSILLLCLLLGVGYLYLNQQKSESQNRARVEEATQCLQQGDNLLALQKFLALEREGESSLEVQYGIFVSAYNLHYYSESLKRWSKLSTALQDSLQSSVYYTLICFSHQVGDQQLEQQLLTRAEQLKPQEAYWKEIHSGKYRVVLEEIPEQLQQLEFADPSEAQVKQAQQAYASGAYEQAVQIWSTLASTVRLSASNFGEYAQACIAAENPKAYEEMRVQAKQQSIPEADLPQFWGNTASNMLNGGNGMILGDRVYFSAFSSYRLSSLALSDWNQSESELATKLPLSIETVGERGAAYMNVREQDLYFADPLDGWKLIVRHMGSKKEEVLLDQPVDQVLLVGSYLYFRNNSNRSKTLCRMQVQSRQVEVLVDHPILSYTMDAHSIYYIDQSQGHTVFRCNWEGKEVRKILNTQTSEVLSDGQHIVYVNTEDQMRIWIAGSEGENPQVLIDLEDCGQMNWSEEGMLYFNHWTLQKLNLHTGEVQGLSEYGAEQINTVGDRILFANENYDYYKMICFPQSGGVYQLQP